MQAPQQGIAGQTAQLQAFTPHSGQLQHCRVGDLAIGQGQIEGLDRQHLKQAEVATGEAAAKADIEAPAGGASHHAHLGVSHARNGGNGPLHSIEQGLATEAGQIHSGATLTIEAQGQTGGTTGQREPLAFNGPAAQLQAGQAGGRGGPETGADAHQGHRLTQGHAQEAQPVLADALTDHLHLATGAGKAGGDAIDGSGGSPQGRGPFGTAGLEG